jgi:hypothetical protein
MKINMKSILIFAVIIAGTTWIKGQVDFGAYHTKIITGQAWEEYSRTMEWADLIVQIKNAGGKLVFWRGNSFLPYWETTSGKWNLTEIIPRSGDGSATMPDRTNTYSHVQIIQNDEDKIIIDWRYLPKFTAGNPHGEVNSLSFVNEVFTITPNGQITRVIKEGTINSEEWNDPLNQTTHVLHLNANGFTEVSRTNPSLSPAPKPIAGNPVKKAKVGSPLVWFNFNDPSQGRTTQESINNIDCNISGPKALWKEGVSGTALQFDGYHSVVVLPVANIKSINEQSLTLEGWFTLGAYPWNWAPIVQQGDNEGYFLGVDSHGYPGFKVKVDNVWQELSVPNQPPYTDANHLALFKWYHIAGTYDKNDGMMRLYINGKQISEKSAGKGGIQISNADVRIGKAGIKREPTEGTHDTGPTEYGLDGMIDEVKIYNTAISAGDIMLLYNKFNPGQVITDTPDMQKRSLPLANTEGKFQAVRTKLNYYETWDNLWRFGNYPDVVVGFDQHPIQYIFWHGVSYIPMMSNELNQRLTNEFNETWDHGDDEPMSDKGCFDSHVRVIEDTKARKVISWRYRLADVYHAWANWDSISGWGDQSEWLWYIYPDGVSVKRMRCYSHGNLNHEYDEQIIILGEGQHPETILKESPVMTLVDINGKTTDLDWNPKSPTIDFKGTVAQVLNFTGKYKPFSIQNYTFGKPYGGEITWYSAFPTWNHWPTAQINSSGRNAFFADRAGHSSISQRKWPLYTEYTGGKAPYYENVLMEGMTNQAPDSLGVLAASWLNAPPIQDRRKQNLTGCTSQGYNMAQRAYLITRTGPEMKFEILASREKPIRNLCFVIKNWGDRNADAQLKINSVLQNQGPEFRQGVTIDTDGTYTLIVWVGLSATKTTNFEITQSVLH